MEITIQNGKRAKKVNCIAHHFNGDIINTNNPDDMKRLNESLIKGLEGCGYRIIGKKTQKERLKDCRTV
jgi:hypothetical protein